MSIERLRIATRKSPLALWQAEHVRARLREIHPGLPVELLTMTTQGDRVLDSPLARLGGKGLFVKELEQGLLEESADIAVHSMKDVPAELPAGLGIGAILEREDPRDAFVSNRYGSIDELPHSARVGTSSLRRQCQLRAWRPDLQVFDLRGNVNTRLGRLDHGDFDAIVLACAGLRRLGMAHRITRAFAPEELLPAIGQGIIGIECRLEDEGVRRLIEPLNHDPTRLRLRAERALNAALAGGCQAPVAGFAVLNDDLIDLRGLVGRPNGGEIVRSQIIGPAQDAESLGRELAEDLLARGADRILAALLGGA